MKNWFLALVLALAPSAGLAQSKLTFKDTIAKAVDTSPALKVFKLELDARELEFKNARSVFFPQLDLSATAGLRETDPRTTLSNRVSTLDLTLSETLYDNGVSFTRYNSAQLQRDIAKISYENERDQLSLLVGQEFLRFSLAAALVEVQEQQFNIIDKQYQTVASLYQQGIRTRKDYLRFKTELRRAEIDFLQAKNSLMRSRVELNRLIGVEARETQPSFDFVPLPVQPESVAKLPQRAPDIDNHFQYRIARLQKQVYQNDVRLVRREFWPQLSLTAGASYTTGDYLGEPTYINNNEYTAWYALGTLKFNLWDWGIRRRNVSIAQARVNQRESELSASLNTFSSDNVKLMLDLNERAKTYSLSRELLDLETSSYGLLSRDYREGKVNYLELIVALRDLLRAKDQFYNSYFGLRDQLLRYTYHEGRLFESVTNAQ
jgi:outer membrane protein TolC